MYIIKSNWNVPNQKFKLTLGDSLFYPSGSGGEKKDERLGILGGGLCSSVDLVI